MTKRIIFFTHLKLWSMGNRRGAPSFHRTVSAYRDAGWEVHLISPMSSREVSVEIPEVRAHRIKLPLESWLGRPRIGFFVRLTRTLVGAAQQLMLGSKLLRGDRTRTVLYAYEVYGVQAAKVLSRAYGAPIVTRFQGTIMAPFEKSLRTRVSRFPHVDALGTRADIVIMTDDGTQGDQMLTRYGNDSAVRHFWRNGVDRPVRHGSLDEGQTPKTRLGIPEEAPVLLTLSRLVHWKRVDRAISALAALGGEWENVHLVVVGDGPEQPELRRLARQKNVEDRVVFAGAVSREGLAAYFETADIFLSLYDLSNLGNPLFEAMFFGLPVVTLDVGDTFKVIADDFNGILLDSPAIDGIVCAVENLLADRECALRLGGNAERYARDNFWSWEERMEAELASVESLLD